MRVLRISRTSQEVRDIRIFQEIRDKPCHLREACDKASILRDEHVTGENYAFSRKYLVYYE